MNQKNVIVHFLGNKQNPHMLSDFGKHNFTCFLSIEQCVSCLKENTKSSPMCKRN